MEFLQTVPGMVTAVACGVGGLVVGNSFIGGRQENHYMVDPLPKFKLLGKGVEATLDNMGQLVSELRQSYNSGISKPIETRIAQLKALQRMLEENEPAIVEALKADLDRPLFECLYYDNLLPLAEVKHTIKNLKGYLRPERKGFNILTFPSTNEIYREPVGVVLVIGTWNYPIMLTLVPVLGAIAAGNCVVLKPCNVSPACSKLLAKLIPRYMDPHIITVVGTEMDGDRHCTSKLLESKFDHIFFTGSPSVGRVIMMGAARHLTPVTLELGGKNPVIVARDANIELAAQRIVWGRMMNAGQQCISPDYVLCEEAVVDALCARMAHYVRSMYGADPKNNGNFGKIVGGKQTERLVELLQTHRGTVVCGGEHDVKAKYVAPTVLRVPLDSPAMEEETFGPILLVVSVPSTDAAIRYIQTRPKPLSMYVFANTRAVQERIIQNTSSGGVTVNATLFHVAHPDLPFGGVGDSGIGAYHGRETFEIFSHKKPVLRKIALPDGGLLSNPFFLYPPWTDLKLKVLRVLAPFL